MSTLLDEIKRLIGTEAGPIHYAIDAGAIRLFAGSIMDPDPLYHDEDYARTTRHGGIIAPPTFFGGATSLRGIPAGDRRPLSAIPLPVPPGWTGVAAGDDFRLFGPVRPGDVLTCREKLVDAYEKQGRSGHLIFTVREKTFTNQHGRVVMVRRSSGALLERPAERPAAAGRETGPVSGLASELPVLEVGPVIVRYLAMFAVATAEFEDIHYDRQYALSRGLPDVIIQGLYKTSLIARMLKEWCGDGTAIRRLNVRHRGMDVAGSTLRVGGRLSGHSQENGQRLTTCEVWVENESGRRSTIGTASLVTG